MFYIKMALRGVLRRYGRSALSIVSVVMGVLVITTGYGFINGTKENIIRAQIDTVGGHVTILPEDYPIHGVQHPVDDLVALDDETRAWLDKESEGWTTRLIFSPRLIAGRDATRARAFGLDPKSDETLFTRKNWKVDGRMPTGKEGVMVSQSLARVMSLERGSNVVLETRTAAGALNALRVQVVGIVSTGSPMLDASGVFMDIELANELVQPEGRFSHLSVLFRNRNAALAMAPVLEARFSDPVRAATWKAETQELLDAQDIRQSMINLIAFALLAIAATGIANTVLMAAYERIREIGTLRAMGMTTGGVVALFVSEGFVMGVVGAAIGGVLSVLIVGKYARDGINFSALIEQQAETYVNIPFDPILYMEFSIPTIIAAMGIGILIAVAASFYPAILASRMVPADAVRA